VRLVALYAREYSRIGPDVPPRDRLDSSAEVLALAYELGDREVAYQTHLVREMSALEAADPTRADAELDAAAGLAAELNIPALQPWVTAARSRRAWLAGRFAEADELNVLALEGALASGDPDIAMLVIGGQAMAQQIHRSDLTDFIPALREFAERYPQHAIVRCFIAYSCVEVGRLDEARVEFERFADSGFDLPRGESWLDAMWALARTCSRLGDLARAAELYELIQPKGDRWLADKASVSLGPIATILGVLAATSGWTEVAALHFEHAMEQAVAFGSPPWLADAQAEFAAMLLAGDDEAEREVGRGLRDAALATADALEMASLAARIRSLGG